MKLTALSPWWDRGIDRGQAWWTGRSVREQVLLGTLVALAILAILLVAVVRPLEAARARAAADIRTFETLAMRVRARDAVAGSPMGGAVRRGPPAAIVAASAAATGVVVQRVEPGGGQITVVLADAPFDAVLRFVADVERTSALRVSEARIEAGQTGAGLVSANFVMSGA